MFLLKASSRNAIRKKIWNLGCFYFLFENKILKSFVQCHLFVTSGELSGSVLSRTGILEQYERDEQQAQEVVTCIYYAGLQIQCSHTSSHLFIYLFIRPSVHPSIHPSIHPSRLHVHTDPGNKNENLERQIVD